MKVHSIEFGQVTWLVHISVPSGGLYLPRALPKVIERYGFVKFPNTDDFLAEKPNIIFQHGDFEGSVIRNFSIHNDGFIAESMGGTETACAFLDDFLQWTKIEFGVEQIETSETYRIYDSHLITHLDIDIASRMEFFSFIAESINKYIVEYELSPRSYEISGIIYDNDSSQLSKQYTSPFRIERRAGQEFNRNVFFSAAPLKTEDHKVLLEKIERLV